MKIALVQLGRIGDMILMTSGIRSIKNTYPNAEIYFIASKSNCFIVENNPNIKQVLVLEKSPLGIIKFLWKLRKIKFDYYIDPKDHFSNESQYIAKLARAKHKIGLNKGKHNAFDKEVSDDKENFNLHFVERVNNALKFANIVENNDKIAPEIYIEKNSNDIVDKFLEKHNLKEFTLINIAASHINKMWETEKWIEFINKTKNQENYVLIAEKTYPHLISEVIDKTGISLFPASSFNVISALISKSKLLITPDTSLVHVAAAFDTPVIALTCNVEWSVIKFYPLSTINKVILPQKKDGRLDLIAVTDLLNSYEDIKKNI